MKYTHQELLDRLKEYTQEWDVFLDNQFEDCDYESYKEQIKSEYNKVLERLPRESSEYIHDKLNSALKKTLLKIKEKELELSAFKEHVNIKDILVEDHLVLIQRRKEKLLANIKENLYSHKLKDLSEIDKVTDKFKFINNAMYYRKQFIKTLQEYHKILETVELGVSPDFFDKSRVILSHLSFLNIRDHSMITQFTLDNLQLYKNHDQYLIDVFEKFKSEYLKIEK